MNGLHNTQVPSGRAGLAVSEIGSGPAVVLLHAGVADRRSWFEVMERLGDCHHVVAYDQRGHGDTTYGAEPYAPLDDLLAVLDTLRIDEAVLVGCSRGGHIAVDAAFRIPERVTALVLVDSAPAGAPPATDVGAGVEELFDAVDAAETAGDQESVNRLEARLWLDGPHAPEGRVGGAARDLFLAMNARALAAPPRESEEEVAPRWHQLQELAVPTLLIVGELDLPVLVDRVRTMASLIPQARFVSLSESAHLPMLDQPDRLSAELASFLADLTE